MFNSISCTDWTCFYIKTWVVIVTRKLTFIIDDLLLLFFPYYISTISPFEIEFIRKSGKKKKTPTYLFDLLLASKPAWQQFQLPKDIGDCFSTSFERKIKSHEEITYSVVTLSG